MTANVYVYHSGQPGSPVLSKAGTAGDMDALLYAIGVTGYGGGVLDSLIQTGGVATATRSAGLNLADGLAGMPHIISISGWDGEYTLSADPGSTACTFACSSGLANPATGTITLKRAPAGMSRLASVSNKSVYQFRDLATMPGYLMIDDSNALYTGVRLAETAASPVDYSTMVGLCPTVAQQAAPGLAWKKSDNSGSGAKPWIACIWRGGVYLFTAWNVSYPTQYDPFYAGACQSLKAGDAYPGIIIGHTATNPGSPGANHSFQAKSVSGTSGMYCQRTYAQTGSAIQFFKIGNQLGNQIGQASTVVDPNGADNAEHIRGPIEIVEGSSTSNCQLRGFMPLLWDPINAGNRSTFDILANMANLSGRKVLLIQTGANGSAYKTAIDITGPAGF
jgi:hypothetical protein